MSKSSSKGKSTGGKVNPHQGGCMPDGGKLQEHNLLATNPLKEQFEPKGAEAVRQHAAMAGQPG
jgi:hypothetical protein